MCTVSVLPCRLGGEEVVRLACNRDEKRSRPAALPPRLFWTGARQAVWPTDAGAGGTWIGVNDAGLVLTVLNVSRPSGNRVSRPDQSRGAIVPELLSCGSLASALRQAATLEPARYAPFRLVLVDSRELAEVRSDGRQLHAIFPQPLAAPRLFTSSGLGDDLVQGPRAALFGEVLRSPDATTERQDAFHRHSWPARQHLSVCMRRPDARTVSYTTLTLSPRHVRLTYHPEAPDTPSKPFSVCLQLAKGAQPCPCR
jgi:hypothetical protein